MTRRGGTWAGWLALLVIATLPFGGCQPAAQRGEEDGSQLERAKQAQARPNHDQDQPPPLGDDAEQAESGPDRAFPYEEPGPVGANEPEAEIQPPEPEGGPIPEAEPPRGPAVEDEQPSASERKPGGPGDAKAAAAPPPAETATGRLAALSEAFREVARRVKPSVVQVAAEVRPGARRRRLTSQVSPEQMQELRRRFGPFLELDPELQQFFRGRGSQQQGPDYDQYNVPLPVGSGSGWIYDEKGHVITNYHVVENAEYIKLTFYDNTQAEAVLVGADPQSDVAVLKTKKGGLTPAHLATEGVEQGDIVLALGSPFRYAFSLTQGIVSATGRRMGILGPQGYENFIQTDAAINPGNSGGPVVNVRGEVVGMSSAIASRSGAFAGIGFAIPSAMIRDVADELIRQGKVERGYLGVMISDDRRLLASFGADEGVLVEDVVEGGPAARAGLRSGDIITALGGEPIESAAALRRQVAQTDPGQTVRLTVLRDGRRRTVDVGLEQQPTEEAEPERAARQPEPESEGSVEAEPLVKLGFEQLQPITSEIARQYGLDPPWGVLVVEVRRFSAAATAGVTRGTIITHAAGEKVTDVDPLREAVEGHDLTQGVRMRVRTPGGPARFVLLSLAD